MEMLTNLLSKRTKIFQIATWVCTGMIVLGFFLPYIKISFWGQTFSESLFKAVFDSGLGSKIFLTFLMFLILIGLSVVVIKYEAFSFVASIILAAGAIVGEIVYVCLAEADGMGSMKAIGARFMDIFFILLIIVGVVAVVAEVYVKYFAEKLASGTTTTQAKGWFCPQCGAPNEATGKFCNKCGTKKPE